MNTTQLSEWDEIEDCEVVFTVDADDLARCEIDPDAALRIAYAIEEQQPELLEIIAKYMAVADDLGSSEARAWLADYYEESDQQYHGYV